MFGALTRRWRRSLAFRVVATTLLAGTVLVGVSLGFLLVRVTNGLVDANTSRSIAEANAGLAAAQQVVLQASEGGPPVAGEGLADSIMNSLVSGIEQGADFEVLLLDGSAQTGTELPERGTNLVEVSSLPPEMRAQVRLEGREVWTYTTVEYVDQPSQPGLVVGSLLTIGTDAAYEVYYLFPYGQLQGTLDLVRSTAWITGVLLVGLLGLLMSLIARHVVLPVRQAARTAELLRAGHLEQRLPVRGEDDLAALASAFNDMAGSLQTQIRALEDLSRLQQRFVSDVSHELRTPLTTIRMASDVLYERRDEIPTALRRSSELLHDQLDRFELLLVDLLEISRFDAGAAHLETEPVDLREVVGAAVAAARPLAEPRGSQIIEMLGDQPCMADCDRRRIERVVRNLLSNAIEHGEGRDIEVRVAGQRDLGGDLRAGLRPGARRRRPRPGLRPLLAGRPVARPESWRHRSGAVDRHGGHAAARGSTGGLGQAGPGCTVPADTAAGGGAGTDRDPGTAAGSHAGERMRRLWMVMLAVAMLASGCAQVPTSGPVVEVDQALPDVGSSSFVRALARPPRPGMTQVEVVQGFLDAASGFEDGHAVAREYLTEQASRSWNPKAGVRVYGNDTESLANPSDGLVTMTAAQVGGDLTAFAVRSVGGIQRTRGDVRPGAGGRTVAHQRCAARIAAVAGRRRAQLPGVPDLLRGSTRRNPRAEPGPVRQQSTGRDHRPRGRSAAGPGSVAGPAVTTGFPPGTRLNSVETVDGVVRVDLDAAVTSADDLARQQLSAQLVWTLRQVSGVRAVAITSDGQPSDRS